MTAKALEEKLVASGRRAYGKERNKNTV